MRPKRQKPTGSGDLFKARLDQIINMKHELVRLAEEIDWDWIDEELADLYGATGRAAVADAVHGRALVPEAHLRPVG